MKKFLLSLAAICSLGLTANAGTITLAMADATDIKGETTKDGNIQPMTSFTIGDYNFSFTSTKEGAAATQQPTFWKADNTLRLYIGCQMTISGGNIAKATEVVLNAKSLKGISADAAGLASAPGFNASYDATAKTVTFTGASTGDFVMTLPADKVANANPNYQILSITINYEEGGLTKKAANMVFTPASVSVALGDTFEAPELTKDTTAPVTYASSNDDVASVDATSGVVRVEGLGTATITATAAENDEYYGGVASYTLTVVDPATILNATFDSNDGFTFEDGTLPEGLTYVWTRDGSYGYMKASAYVNKTNYAVDGAYLVSPELDLAGRKNVTLSFSTVVNFYASVEASKEEATVHVREVGGEWGAALVVPAWPTALGWKPWVESGDISLESYVGKKIQIGFKYTSTAEKAGTWEVDNVLVKGDKTGSAIETVEAADADAPVEFFNLQGVRVANPENGLFIRRQGNKVEKVVIR